MTSPVTAVTTQPRSGEYSCPAPNSDSDTDEQGDDGTDPVKSVPDFEPGHPVDKLTDGIIQPFLWGIYFVMFGVTYSSCGQGQNGEDILSRLYLLVFIVLRHCLARKCSPYSPPDGLEISFGRKICARSFQVFVTIIMILIERKSRNSPYTDYFSYLEEVLSGRNGTENFMKETFYNDVVPCKLIYSWPTSVLIYDALLYLGIMNIILVFVVNAFAYLTHPNGAENSRITKHTLNILFTLFAIGAVVRSGFVVYPILRLIITHEVPIDIEHPDGYRAIVLTSIILVVMLVWVLVWTLALFKKTTCVYWVLFNFVLGVLTLFLFLSVVGLLQHTFVRERQDLEFGFKEKQEITLRVFELWGLHLVFGIFLYLRKNSEVGEMSEAQQKCAAYACGIPACPVLCLTLVPWACIQNCKISADKCCTMENLKSCGKECCTCDCSQYRHSSASGRFSRSFLPIPVQRTPMGGGGTRNAMPWNGGHPWWTPTNQHGIPV